jgi:WD40 repeat protein
MMESVAARKPTPSQKESRCRVVYRVCSGLWAGQKGHTPHTRMSWVERGRLIHTTRKQLSRENNTIQYRADCSRVHVSRTVFAHQALARMPAAAVTRMLTARSTIRLMSISLHMMHASARHAIVLRPSSRALPPARMSSDDRPDEGDAQSDLFASLRSRLDKIGESCEERWREAECQSSIKLALEGWVRRIALDWPRAAIGTADGYVCLADLESGEVLTRKKAHPDYVDGEESARDMRLLHGEYDGGGLTSIALSGSFIASAGRDGGARLWHLGRAGEDGDELELQDRGELRDAGDAVVSRTLLSVDDELAQDGATGPGAVRCWTGGLDGVVRCWQAPMAAAASAPRCVLRVKAAGAVLDLALLEQRNLLACATADGAVELFSTIDGTPCGRWRPFADGTDGELPLSTVAARSVAITHVDAAGEQRCALSSWATCPRPACM